MFAILSSIAPILRAAFLLAVACLAVLAGTGCTPRADRPAALNPAALNPAPLNPAPLNVVLLYADDWRHDTLGCAGNPVVQTPRLDRLARDGVRFTHNSVTTSICGVSRATMLLSLIHI
jgi:arylsulfatase